jgi:hypothetical protein
MATPTSPQHRSNALHFAILTIRFPDGHDHTVTLSSRCNCAWSSGHSLLRAGARECGWAQLERWIEHGNREHHIVEAISDGEGNVMEYDLPF